MSQLGPRLLSVRTYVGVPVGSWGQANKENRPLGHLLEGTQSLAFRSLDQHALLETRYYALTGQHLSPHHGKNLNKALQELVPAAYDFMLSARHWAGYQWSAVRKRLDKTTWKGGRVSSPVYVPSSQHMLISKLSLRLRLSPTCFGPRVVSR